MRANKIYKFITGAFLTLMLAVGFSSCQDFDFPVDESYSRMFRPGGIGTDSITATSAIVRWDVMPGVDHYVIEISRDSLLFDPVIDSIEIPVKYNAVKITGLFGDTQHSVRVRSVSATGIPDSKWSAIAFKTKAEQIMSPLSPDDIGFTSVKLNWIPNSAVTHVLLTPQNADTLQPIKIMLNDSVSAKQTGSMTVKGLTSGVTYNVGIYNTDVNLRGSLTFRTNEIQSIGQIIEVQEGDSINLKLAEATSNAVTLIFKQGTYYQHNTSITIPDGMSVVLYGMPGSNLPTISFNSINLSSSHGTIRFENIDLTGKFKDADGTLNAGQRDYLFNQSTATMVNHLEFKNCKFHNYNRTLVRMQATGQKTISNLVIDGCVMYEQGAGSYPLIYNNIANALIDNISLKNSTFYNMQHNFIVQSLVNMTSLVISDCTFNNVVGSGRYFIDCGAFGPTNNFLISNSIFGLSYNSLAKGIRKASTISLTVTDSYKTSDWVTASAAIPNLTEYTGTSTDLFTDPTNGNFTIKDNSFAGKTNSGDPRWRPTE